MKIVLFVLLIVFSVVYPAIGDDSLTSLRCKSGLIAIGTNKLEVVSKCGEPNSKGTVERRAQGGTRAEYVQIEEWTYNFGRSDFIYVMEIEGASLTAIRRGGRGF
jgi:hypothetical protein